ncbi:alpha-L-rhamnosidase C-terminal domain-containing protein [Pseudomonas sp. PA27(2017)]|uniref:alpha-L-rhamnosidase-related protein n=1 Tax=Pseudomonas sp. PA27(2017) TaxID=1932112 RepID=UPI00095F4309|nr:alpha-L-rhamnosidase C-terminal domain-containing protein [Pseudomonas sp. PA27(2017)]OLU33082.1 hypothetical protein BVH06_09480 [Pseudomonas sp. PA27(2017)]
MTSSKYSAAKRVFFAVLSVTAITAASAFAYFQSKPAPTVRLVDIKPVRIIKEGDKVLIDFGKTWFGKIDITPNAANQDRTITVIMKETSEPKPFEAIGPEPPAVRFELVPDIKLGKSTLTVPLPERDSRLMPERIGAVMPLRYVEIIGWKGEFPADAIGMLAAVAQRYQDTGTVTFKGAGDAELNAIWELSSHTMAATSFAALFVDGDRERLPYEADAYINQLGWHYTTGETSVPRRTFEHLVENPSWPTEWQAHMLLMAWADYMHTGDKAFLAKHYERLKFLTYHELMGDIDGLVDVSSMSPEFKARTRIKEKVEDIVDWLPTERDGHEMRPKNTVTNAFIYISLVKMSHIAKALDKTDDQKTFTDLADKLRDGLFAHASLPNGLLSDGVGSTHTSAHSLFIPLAFGLVPEEKKPLFIAALKDRIASYDGGFPGSIFTAQYLLEALYQEGEDQAALELIVNRTDRGWLHAIEKYGATVTHEAWDIKYKYNEDWTHAWGAAPANIMPRFMAGVEPVEPGWKKWRLSPSRALTQNLQAVIPTPHGSILLQVQPANQRLAVTVPEGSTAVYTQDSGVVMELGAGEHTLTWKAH